MQISALKAIAELTFVKNATASKTPHPVGLCSLFCFLLIGLLHTSANAEDGQLSPDREHISAGNAYIGPAACQDCHPDKYEGFVQTAHHITSRLADAESIAGSFAPDDAFMFTRNDQLWFEMSTRADGFYQTANIMGGDNKLHEHSERMEIVTGSGKIGQTYLYWKDNRLYQLPISYWAASDKWINSPGFPDGQAVFDRPVGPRCMECHATYFAAEDYERNVYGQGEFMLGISCERCHGPGAQHATYQAEATDDTGAPHITHPGDLSRQRSIEICAQCHSGAGIKHGKPFTYRPGLPLAEYIEPEPHDAQNRIGVHSNNQVARLSLSTCFQQSDDLTCASCHDPHAPERGDSALFSSRCLDCHTTEACGMEPTLGHAIADNCIDCHMPGRQDKKTGVQNAKGMIFPVMPEHLIGIYPDATRRFMTQRAEGK